MQNKTLALWALLAALASSAVATPMGTEFTYQGRLCDGGVPANGLYDFTFELYTAPDPPGDPIDSRTLTAVWVTNGLFTTNINFGIAPFAGEARWLKILARTNGVGEPVALGPRQELKPTPYALYAASAATAATATTATAMPWGGLTGVPPDIANGDQDTTYTNGEGLTLDGTKFKVDTNYLYGRFWALGGNFGTTAGTHFVGTTDNQPLELRVKGTRALRLEPATDGGGNVHPTLNGGAPDNSITNSHGATIGGGWSNTLTNAPAGFLGGGSLNAIRNSERASIGGGQQNEIETSIGAAIGGGEFNRIRTGAIYSVVPGGSWNSIGASSLYSTIGGGYLNEIQTNATYVTVAGGNNNQVHANAKYATIGGGRFNDILANATNATIAGGHLNEIGEYSIHSFLGGGQSNSLSGGWSALVGGFNNVIAGGGSSVGGGVANQVLWDYGVVAGGSSNTVYGTHNMIGCGTANTAFGGGWSFIGAGYGNYHSNSYQSVISGGYSNRIEAATCATIPGGQQARASAYGQFAYASGQFAAQGDAQVSMFVLRRTSSGTTTSELFLNGDSGNLRIPVPPDTTLAFDILVVGRTPDESVEFGAYSAAYQIRGLVERDGLGTKVRSNTLTTPLWEDLDWNAWAEAGNGYLLIKVSGSVGYTVRWVANVRTSEVTFPR
jgi:trimeric autotransporter adhesin